jgi:hypothetical protein
MGRGNGREGGGAAAAVTLRGEAAWAGSLSGRRGNARGSRRTARGRGSERWRSLTLRTSDSLSSSSPYPNENTRLASPLSPSRDRFPRRSTRYFISAAEPCAIAAPVPTTRSR